MNRNRIKKQKHHMAFSLIFPLITFILIFGLFYYGITQVSAANDREMLQSLETTIHRDIVHCYASEGVYPPSIEYLEEKYGLTYDHNKYYIDYHPIAANLLPEVTIMEVTR